MPEQMFIKKDPGILFFGETTYSRINGGITTMVIVSKYRLERNEEKDIFSNQRRRYHLSGMRMPSMQEGQEAACS